MHDHPTQPGQDYPPVNPVYPAPPQQPYPAQPYGQQYPGQPPVVYLQTAEPRNGLGLTALILAIIGLVSCLIPILGMFVGGPLSILAFIFGLVGYSRANKGKATNKKTALWGWILAIGCFIFACIDLGIVVTALNHVSNCLDTTSTALHNLDNSNAQSAQQTACSN